MMFLFQDYRTFRDKFVGKIEFKDTLRRGAEEPKRPDRSRGRVSRPYESRDYAVPSRGSGYLIESDFDFRSPPTTRDSSRDRGLADSVTAPTRRAADHAPRRTHEDVYASPRRRQEEIYAASSRGTRVEDVYATPSRGTRIEDIYASSPRRKELRIVVGTEKPVGNGSRAMAR